MDDFHLGANLDLVFCLVADLSQMVDFGRGNDIGIDYVSLFIFDFNRKNAICFNLVIELRCVKAKMSIFSWI